MGTKKIDSWCDPNFEIASGKLPKSDLKKCEYNFNLHDGRHVSGWELVSAHDIFDSDIVDAIDCERTPKSA